MESIAITNQNDAKRVGSDELKRFKETLKRENGRYQVALPWNDEANELPENRGLAIGRLKSLTLRLQKDPELLSPPYTHNIIVNKIVNPEDCQFY